MDSLREFFNRMNDIDFSYVVLRNWDGLPYDVKLGEHSDLDLLVYDFSHFCELFPQAKAEHPYPRVRMKIQIDDSYLYIDVRHIGDDYYPEEFERAILTSREYNQRGFYTPNPLHHKIALAYHAVHHKNGVAREYVPWLGVDKIDEILEALKASTVGWVAPKDKSVGAYHGYWKGATAIVTKEEGRIKKQQVSYILYTLIKNEYEKLSKCKIIHFPEVYSYSVDTIIMEDCGEPLLSNIPEDYERQLREILADLKSHSILHRDIKLDNLMVKDGVIKLIDFGWAVYEGEVEVKAPPSCLGYPNKPSDGFSDEYSMRVVMKQIDYILEDKEVLA